MADDKSGHVYGSADRQDDQAPTSEGMRGEKAATGDRPDLRREETLSDGRTVEIEAESGIAFAESEGAGHDPDAGNVHDAPMSERGQS